MKIYEDGVISLESEKECESIYLDLYELVYTKGFWSETPKCIQEVRDKFVGCQSDLQMDRIGYQAISRFFADQKNWYRIERKTKC